MFAILVVKLEAKLVRSYIAPAKAIENVLPVDRVEFKPSSVRQSDFKGLASVVAVYPNSWVEEPMCARYVFLDNDAVLDQLSGRVDTAPDMNRTRAAR